MIEQKLIDYVLAGLHDKDTELAKKMLDDAGIKYRFALADISEGAMPQLTNGLLDYVGLEQIVRFAKQKKKNINNA